MFNENTFNLNSFIRKVVLNVQFPSIFVSFHELWVDFSGLSECSEEDTGCSSLTFTLRFKLLDLNLLSVEGDWVGKVILEGLVDVFLALELDVSISETLSVFVELDID